MFLYLPRITEGPFDPEVIQSEYSIQDEEIKVTTLQPLQEWSIIFCSFHGYRIFGEHKRLLTANSKAQSLKKQCLLVH